MMIRRWIGPRRPADWCAVGGLVLVELGTYLAFGLGPAMIAGGAVLFVIAWGLG